MEGIHEAALGSAPSARTYLRYRKDAKRASWDKMHAEVDRTLASILRNWNLRKSGRHLTENEASKLYLFGE